MVTSRIGGKTQATIPQTVRKALGVGQGDEIAYAIERDRVVMTKAARRPAEYPFATFSEWESESDRLAYVKP